MRSAAGEDRYTPHTFRGLTSQEVVMTQSQENNSSSNTVTPRQCFHVYSTACIFLWTIIQKQSSKTHSDVVCVTHSWFKYWFNDMLLNALK